LGVFLFAGLAGPARGENLPENQAPKARTAVEIGMPRTLFHGLNETLMKVGATPFLGMVRSQTGFEAGIHFPSDSRKLADAIDKDEIQIGVMPGYEFAFARKLYPDLIPIAVAAPMQPIQSFCLVPWDSKAANIGDLSGKAISLPSIHRDYCEIFLSREREQHMKGKAFSSHLSRPLTEDAVYDVIEGRAECTVIDCAALKFFERVNPGQFTNLKVLCKSEPFPNACIVVKKGKLANQDAEKFVKALLNAPNDKVGGPMLTAWKLKGFTRVPADYTQQLQAFEKAYPAPAMWKATEEK